MNWYYVENGQQAGPVDDTRLQELVASGAIQPDTLVWHEGMPEWRPYREVKSAAAPPPAAASSGGPEAVCSECGRIFPAGEVIRYGNAVVCAACKPVFVQKLKEGAVMGAALEYAGFGTRFAAKFLDGLILWLVNAALGLAFGLAIGAAARGSGKPEMAVIGMQVVLILVSVAINLGYNIFFIGKFGATLGKMACKIKVVTPEGGPVGFGRAAGRAFAEILSGIICYIGYLMPLWDEEKRALHDRLANTRVVKK